MPFSSEEEIDNELISLIERGFNQSYVDLDDWTIHVDCSQCEALVISGLATHEKGCPNALLS